MTAVYCPGCGTALSTRTVEGRDRAYCDSCERVIWDNPLPVAWVLVRADERVLLVKRAVEPDAGTWDIPGGFLEVDESFREAAVRELEEETGVSMDANSLALHDTFAADRAGERVVGVVFEASIVPGAHEVAAGPEATASRFWRPEDLSDGDEVVRDCCRPFLDGKG